MALGLSIYPAKASGAEIVEYLQMARKYNYEWIFTSLLAITSGSDEAEKLQSIIKEAKALGYQLQVDVSPQVFVNLNLDPSDLSYFANLGVNALRLDEPFNGQIESMMTFNPYGIDIIINASSKSHYLDLILDYQADKARITACHNFYPQAFTGLERQFFLETSSTLKAKGIKTAAFINAKSGTICSKYAKDGCPTLEEHRYQSIISQVRDLKYTNLIDDIYVSTMFVSEADLQTISTCYYGEAMITIDINLACDITALERKIINELHLYRGDISEYMIRSTQPRVKYADQELAVNNAKCQLKRGDVVILNDNYEHYAKELHLVLRDFAPNNLNYNVVAKVDGEQLTLLDMIAPWAKFKLNIIE